MEKQRAWRVGEQAINVLAIYRPTDRLEGGDIIAQVWREDFNGDQEWRDAAHRVAKALNELGQDKVLPAPDFEQLGIVDGSADKEQYGDGAIIVRVPRRDFDVAAHLDDPVFLRRL